jgi:hypothetical protein
MTIGDFVRSSIIPAAGIVLGRQRCESHVADPAPEVFGNATIDSRRRWLVLQPVVVCVNGVFVSFTMTVIDAFGDAENGDRVHCGLHVHPGRGR